MPIIIAIITIINNHYAIAWQYYYELQCDDGKANDLQSKLYMNVCTNKDLLYS